MDLLLEKGEIALITINRPTALNALNRQLVENLATVIDDVRGDTSVRVLIITGVGDRAFIAGADIAAMSEMTAIEGLEFSRLGHRGLQTMEDLPIPTLAAVNGF